jgi:hypothetical protein
MADHQTKQIIDFVISCDSDDQKVLIHKGYIPHGNHTQTAPVFGTSHIIIPEKICQAFIKYDK